MRYKRRPIEVDAILWMGDNIDEVRDFIKSESTVLGEVDGNLKIMSFDGYLTAHRGDYLIKNHHGDIYPCNVKSFLEIYEEVN